MSQPDLELLGLSDPRLAVHAVGALPAWLWSADGRRVLWANPVGAHVFAAADGAALAARTFGPADVHRRQVAQLARRLPESGAMRLERLRGFGATLGGLATCGCARLDLANGSSAVLITSTDTVGRNIPLVERLQRLVAPSDAALVAFTRDGLLAGASASGRNLFGACDLSDDSLHAARNTALAEGHADVQLGLMRARFYRVGGGPQTAIVMALIPGTAEAPHPRPLSEDEAAGEPLEEAARAAELPPHTADEPATMAAPDYEAPELSNEAPSEILLMDDAPPPPPGVEPAPSIHEVSEPQPATPFGEADATGNVVPFRPAGETRHPALTPVENNAFHELARQLSARLEGDMRASPTDLLAALSDKDIGARVSEQLSETRAEPRDETAREGWAIDAPAADAAAEWLAPEPPPVQGESQRDRILLDLLPTGVLIYRLDRLLYANASFLAQMGYADLAALEHAGGLDALYVEPGVPASSSTSEAGTPVTISVADGPAGDGQKAAARLFTIAWDGDIAHALVFTPPSSPSPPPQATAPVETPATVPAPLVLSPPAGHADAEDLGAILDVTAEGVLMFDAGGNIHACNRSAEALFGYDGPELVRRNLTELFASESTRLVLDYLDGVREAGATSALDQGREVLGRVRQGGIIPLSITIGRTRPDGPNFFAVIRDLSQARRGETELSQARRLADRAANAKADMLARISHEIRAPLNAIIGFADVMIGERFGAVGNPRYVDYLKDIRTSGERVVGLINDLLELSRIETGRLELSFTNQNLNELVEACVAALQPQANRARIIIRSSLSHALPPVVADGRALRQIALNLISSSISLANAGGQVIVSTALSDLGEAILRVRDTGHALNDQEVAAALEPFRTRPPSDQGSDGTGLSLSLTKALVEANRAQFHIKAAPKSGTLLEVVFSRAMARNQSLG